MKGRNPLPGAIAAGPVIPAPASPAWLDAEARGEWERVVPILAKLGQLTDADLSTLAAYCVTWSAYLTALATVQAEGRYRESRGAKVLHPAVKDAKELLTNLRGLIADLGLSPTSRGRLHLPPQLDPARDDVAAFLKPGS